MNIYKVSVYIACKTGTTRLAIIRDNNKGKRRRNNNNNEKTVPFPARASAI